MGRVWPRHGHRGRPLNLVVRAHRNVERQALCPVSSAPLEAQDPREDPEFKRRLPEGISACRCAEYGTWLSGRLCRAIWTAVERVPAIEPVVRSAPAEYAACPNCASDLDTVGDRFIECQRCHLKLHSLVHDELVQFKLQHKEDMERDAL